MIEKITKTCIQCGKELDIDSFRKVKSRSKEKQSQGLFNYCGTCLDCERGRARKAIAKRREALGVEEYRKYTREHKRKRLASMTPEEKREMRKKWACEAHMPHRDMCDINKVAQERRLVKAQYTTGMTCYNEWYDQTHTLSRWMIECKFLGKKEWEYPLLNDSQRYKVRYHCDDEYRISERIRRQIKKKYKEAKGDCYIASVLKNGIKNSSIVKELVGCDMVELREHLASTLPSEYEWDDFLNGDMHIDHIIPKDMFDVIGSESEARLCWNVNNLRLIPKQYNMKKSNKAVASMVGSRKEIIVNDPRYCQA